MKHLLNTVALALSASAPLVASAGSITVDFERQWNGGNGDIAQYYNGGKAGSPQDTATGPKLGVSFQNISGFNNNYSPPDYSGAPSPIGTAYAEGTSDNPLNAVITLSSGYSNFSFYYSSFIDVIGAVKAYSANGTLLGALDIKANDIDGTNTYDKFSQASFSFNGYARSFDLTALGGTVANGNNVALFDNVTVVPEPGVVVLLMTGGALAFVQRRKSAK